MVPDVYRKYILRCKRKPQLQHANNSRQSMMIGSKQGETSQQQQPSFRQKNTRTIDGKISATRIDKRTDDTMAEMSGSTGTGLHSPFAFNRKSRTSRRKSSLTKKFQPVLEPLMETIN